jgi:hypothetical protein
MKIKREQPRIPPALQAWVDSQTTMAPPKDDPVFPYSEFWWRAVACVLLSGRVRPKWEKNLPNLTDVTRFCKTANFNQYYFQTAAEFLVAGDVVAANFNECYYQPGKHFEDFWSRDLRRIKTVAQKGLISLISRLTPFHSWRPTLFFDGVYALLAAFFAALEGRALLASQFGKSLLAFSKLPERELTSFMEDLAIPLDEANWESWLDDKGQSALINALYTAAWAFETTKEKQDWFCLSQTGRVMLGLEPAPTAAPEAKDFKVLPDRSVLAGIDLDAKTLAVLFRHCRTKRIERILEFRVDAPALKEMPSTAPPGKELLNVLKPCAPLPPTVLEILKDGVPACGGPVLFRPCRGLIKIENPELLSLIRTHPRLKGYLDREAPPGYLIIKDGADPFRFIERCQQHGFEVKPF